MGSDILYCLATRVSRNVEKTGVTLIFLLVYGLIDHFKYTKRAFKNMNE